jgi:hypothetical protein
MQGENFHNLQTCSKEFRWITFVTVFLLYLFKIAHKYGTLATALSATVALQISQHPRFC